MIYIDLLIGFLEVGFFSFGGGYAAIPLIRDVVTAHGWLDDELLAYMIAVSESTPGPIMVNMATYVGSAKAGIPGAFIATTAVVLPAFTVIVLIMKLAAGLIKNSHVQAVLGGLKPCIIGIIMATGLNMLAQNCVVKAGAVAAAEGAGVVSEGLAAEGARLVSEGLAAEGAALRICGLGIDVKAVLFTFVLGVVYFGSRKLPGHFPGHSKKKGISPIGLICLAAIAGVLVYGI
jgi:chromate transporter